MTLQKRSAIVRRQAAIGNSQKSRPAPREGVIAVGADLKKERRVGIIFG
jgi:hypothetical protein